MHQSVIMNNQHIPDNSSSGVYLGNAPTHHRASPVTPSRHIEGGRESRSSSSAHMSHQPHQQHQPQQHSGHRVEDGFFHPNPPRFQSANYNIPMYQAQPPFEGLTNNPQTPIHAIQAGVLSISAPQQPNPAHLRNGPTPSPTTQFPQYSYSNNDETPDVQHHYSQAHIPIHQLDSSSNCNGGYHGPPRGNSSSTATTAVTNMRGNINSSTHYHFRKAVIGDNMMSGGRTGSTVVFAEPTSERSATGSDDGTGENESSSSQKRKRSTKKKNAKKKTKVTSSVSSDSPLPDFCDEDFNNAANQDSQVNIYTPIECLELTKEEEMEFFNYNPLIENTNEAENEGRKRNVSKRRNRGYTYSPASLRILSVSHRRISPPSTHAWNIVSWEYRVVHECMLAICTFLFRRGDYDGVKALRDIDSLSPYHHRSGEALKEKVRKLIHEYKRVGVKHNLNVVDANRSNVRTLSGSGPTTGMCPPSSTEDPILSDPIYKTMHDTSLKIPDSTTERMYTDSLLEKHSSSADDYKTVTGDVEGLMFDLGIPKEICDLVSRLLDAERDALWRFVVKNSMGECHADTPVDGDEVACGRKKADIYMQRKYHINGKVETTTPKKKYSRAESAEKLKQLSEECEGNIKAFEEDVKGKLNQIDTEKKKFNERMNETVTQVEDLGSKLEKTIDILETIAKYLKDN